MGRIISESEFVREFGISSDEFFALIDKPGEMSASNGTVVDIDYNLEKEMESYAF